MADSVKAFFDTLAPDASKASGLNATFQFDITGDDGGQWFAKISEGNVEIGAGVAENPTIVLTSTAANFLDLINGKINGQMAFLTGKLKIKGDMTLAMKLESLFKLG